MERRFVIIVITVAIVVTAAVFTWRFLPSSSPTQGGAPVRVTFESDHVGGMPGMNSTEFWVARITDVSTNESLSSYKASLLANRSVLVEPVALKAGPLGTSIHPIFEFFDEGTMCYPTPCGPPEGPDGNLSVDDYFRMSYPDPETAYTVRVVWAATGEVAGEIVIET